MTTVRTRPALLIALAVAASLAVAAAAGCGGGVARQRITVTGTGTGKASPDEARVTVAVVTEGPSVQQATAPNNQQAQAVVAALKGLGLDEKSLKTETVEITPKYSDPGAYGGTSDIVGYTAITRVQVTTKKVDTVGQVIETALAAGANNVDTLEMVTTAQESAEAAGLKAALTNARKKAEAAAAAEGRKLGGVITVTEVPPGTVYAYPAAGGAGEGAPPVSPGQNEFTVSARVTFELR